jgi:RHS repeat-associated protein
LTPAVDIWTGQGGDTNFSTAGNWDTHAVPAAGDTIVFDSSATNPSATVDAGFAHAIASFSVTAGWTGTITIASPLTVTGTANFAGGTITGSSSLTVQGLLTWTNGVMSGTGTTTAAGGLQLGAADDKLDIETLDTRTFNNAGAAVWIGDGFFDATGSHDHYFNQLNGSAFNNQVGASLTIQNDAHWFSDVQFQFGYPDRPYSHNDGSTFINAGALTKSAGAGVTEFDVIFTNNGSVAVQQGTLSLAGDGSASGSFTVASGTTLGLDSFAEGDGSSSHTMTLTGSSSISGAGTVRIGDNATFNMAGSYNVTGATNLGVGTLHFTSGASVLSTGPLTIGGGTANFSSGSQVTIPGLSMSAVGYVTSSTPVLTGTDDLSITGPMIWKDSGVISGAGSVTTHGGLTISPGLLTLNGRSLNLASDTTVTGTYGGAQGLTLQNGASINNQAGHTFDFQIDYPPAITGGVFNNAGIVQKSAGTGQVSVNGVFNNSGSVLAESGTFYVGDSGADSGSYAVSAGATLQVSGADMTASSSISGAGKVDFPGLGITSNLRGTYNISGATSFSGQVVNFSGTVISLADDAHTLKVNGGAANFLTAAPAIRNILLQNGTLNFSGGQPIAATQFDISGGTFTGSDTLTVSGQFTWGSGQIRGSGILKIDGGAIFTGGQIYQHTVNIRNDADFSSQVELLSGATLHNLAGSTIHVHAGAIGGVDGTLVNDGSIIRSTGDDKFPITVPFTGSGTLEVGSGTVTVLGGGVFDGTVVVRPGAILDAMQWELGEHSTITGTGTLNVTNLTIDGGFAFTGPILVGGYGNNPQPGYIVFNSDAVIAGSVSVFHGDFHSRGNVTLSGPISLSSSSLSGTGVINARGGLSLQGNCRVLEVALNNFGAATWDGQQPLTIYLNAVFTNEPGATLSVQGGTAAQNIYLTADGTFKNAGSMVVNAGNAFAIIEAAFINTGTLAIQSGTLKVPGFQIDGSGAISGAAAGTLEINGIYGSTESSLAGSTTNANQYSPLPQVVLEAPLSEVPYVAPLEVMSADLGATAAGFIHNFAFNQLTIKITNHPNDDPPLTETVQLVDKAKNSASTGPEALYVNTLVVTTETGGDPSATAGTLDLNGLHVYARLTQIDPTLKIIHGTITLVPDGGPLGLGWPAVGKIGASGEKDDWTFYGKSGQLFAATLNTGSGALAPPLTPTLDLGQISLIDPSGKVVATAASGQAGADATLSNIHLSADGTYHVIVQAAGSQPGRAGDYGLTVWDASPHSGPLNLGQNSSGVLTTPFSVDTWTFAAAAGAQVQFHLMNATNSGIQFDLTGPGGYAAFSNLTSDSMLLTLPANGAYTVSVHGAQGATGAYSFRVDQPNPTVLTLGTPYSGSLVQTGQEELFKITLAQGGPLLVALTDNAAVDHNELYVGFGAPPTRASAEYPAQKFGPAGQQVLVSSAAPGDWYVLVYGESIPAPSTFTLVATATNEVVTAVTPSQVGNGHDVTLNVSGAGFDAKATVSLVSADGTQTYAAASVQVDGSDQLTAVFGAGAIPAGTYGIQVTRGDGATAILPQSVTITSGGKGVLETNLIVPFPIGYHQASTFYVSYRNTGSAAMLAPLLNLTGVMDGAAGALLSLDPANANLPFTTDTNPPGFSQSVQILASGATPGLLQPGESVTVPVYYGGWLRGLWDLTRPPISFSVGVTEADDTTPIDWNSLKDSLRPSTISVASWSGIYSNVTAELGSNWGSYITRLDNIASYLGHVGETVTDVSRLWSFNLSAAIGFSPLSALASATDATVDAPGLSPDFSRSFGPSIVDRNRLGRLGYGWSDDRDVSLQLDAAGDVIVTGPGSSQRIFTKNGSRYFAQPGDHGTLTALADGTYALLETNGQLTDFKADGTLNYLSDANGNRITAGYSGGHMTSLTHSSGQSLQLHYNAAGLIDSVTDSAGRKTTYQYDAQSQLIAATDFGGLTTHYAYSFTGSRPATDHALASITYPDGSARQFAYDAQGRISDTHLTAGAEDVAFSYDAFGTVIIKDAVQQQDSASLGTRMFFDDNGLPVKEEDPVHGPVLLTYDNNLNLIRATNGEGQSYRFTYDTNGNLLHSTDPLNGTQQYSYAASAVAAGNEAVGSIERLASATDANGNVTKYQSDTNGNLRTITYADGSQESNTYDPLGDPLSFTSRSGDVIKLTVDTAGHLTAQTYADGSTLTYSYDSHGNLLTATDASGTISLTYDSADRLTGVSYPNGRSLTFVYDSFGRRSRMSDQDHFTVNYNYDGAGRLTGLTDNQNNLIVNYTYDPVGRLSRNDLGNGTYTTYAYDAAGQLLNLINHAPNGSVNSQFDYTYDDLGRCTSMVTAAGTWQYGYDANGRLVSVTHPGGHIQYKYDAAGNRTAVTDSSGTTIYSVNQLNETTSIGNASLKYDLNGNLISQTDGASTTTYEYDALNRLVGLSTPEGTSSYQYDALGNLGSAIDNAGLQSSYLVDPTGLPSVVGQYQGTQTTHYTYGLGLLSQVTAAGSNYYDFDAIGSTVGLSGAAGSYLNSYSYLPFGETLSATGQVSNPFTYMGEMGGIQQPSGLSYMRARFYAADRGSFLSPDPLRLPAVSSYVYVGNNPTQFVDPSGQKFTDGKLYKWGKKAYEKLNVVKEIYDAAQEGNEAGQELRTSALQMQNAYTIPDDPGVEIDGEKVRVARMSLAASIKGVFNQGIQGIKDAADGSLKGVVQLAARLAGAAFGARSRRSKVPANPPNDGNGGNDNTTRNSAAQDPNDKIGPAAFGSAGFVLPNQPFSYRVDFENDPTATAPAQIVTITDQLDANLDWNTFQLTDVGFGSTELLIPAGTRHYQATVPMTYHNRAIDVAIELGIHSDTGEVYATFTSLDPDTQLAPEILTGFLPPEDGTGMGSGHFTYLITPKTGLPTGTQIRNVADIVFDDNAPLATDLVDDHDPSKGVDPTKQVLRTIDVGAPSSTVTALPAESANGFTLSWSGSDDAGGSGIGTYDVYVSDNGGPFTALLTGTAATSTPFVGTAGHIYSFCSVATDNVGHRQPTPDGAQASTTILPDSVAPTSTVAALANFSKPSFTISWSGSDNAGGSGIASYDVFVSDNGGAFTALLTGTSSTTMTFHGAGEHSYAFYSVATDKAGNRQPAPAAGQATTQAFLDTPNKQYVAAVYTTLLQRPVDVGGLNYWSSRLDNHEDRSVIAALLTHSAEYFQTNVVKPAYQQFLSRTADQGGLDYWTAKLQAGLTDELMQAGFIASDEFYRIANDSATPVSTSPAHDRAWVDALYESLLGRKPDQTGEDYWTGQLQGIQTRLQVAAGFTGSTEGLSVRIQQTYERYLGRAADPAGLAYWLSRYKDGAVNEDIVTGFIGSDEFFAQATKP